MASAPDATPQREALLRYSNGAVAMHWLTALLVIIQLWLGFAFNWMERGPERSNLFLWHKTIGATILLVAIARLLWRLTHKPPPFPEELPRWERISAVWTHRAFYFLLIALPLTGLAAVSARADGATTPLQFGLALPVIPGLTDPAGIAFGNIHVLLVLLTLALLLLHVGAALKHQFIDKSRVSGRMPPFSAGAGEPARPRD